MQIRKLQLLAGVEGSAIEWDMLLGIMEREKQRKRKKGDERKALSVKNFELYPKSYGSHNHWKKDFSHYKALLI